MGTAAVSGVFALMVFRRFLVGRKRHNLLWSLGLLAIMGAALSQLVAEFSGAWPEAVFRFYYFLAGTGAAMLGAGTMYLLRKKRWADIFLYVVVALAGAQAVVCTVSPLNTSYLDAGEIETGVTAAAPAMRVLMVVLNIVGTAALLAGALLSFYATRRLHNLLIVAGTLVFASGGSIAGLFPEEGGASTVALYVGNLVGIVLLFLGFWLSHAAKSDPLATAATVAGPPA
jgi:hypothetical protein